MNELPSSLLDHLSAASFIVLVIIGTIVITFFTDLFPRQPIETFDVGNVEKGKRYAITVAGEEASFLVLSINEETATFEVLMSPSYGTPAQKTYRWAHAIAHESAEAPRLYYSAHLANSAMEQKLHVGRHNHAHA